MLAVVALLLTLQLMLSCGHLLLSAIGVTPGETRKHVPCAHRCTGWWLGQAR